MKTKSGKPICPLVRYFNLAMELKFNEKSEITFDIPAWADGIDTPFYEHIVPDTLIEIIHYGVFCIQSISTKGDGIKEIRSCTANSIECELEGKQVVLGDGTYKFYDPIDPTDTILGICMESNRSWKIGSVPARLYSVYRTFKQTETSVLDFMLNQVQEPFQCAFVFDTFTRTVNVVDALEAIEKLPIYMSFDNLVKNTTITSKPDQFATRFTVTGADGVNIRSVNPTGTNQIIDLSYWIENESIPADISGRYRDWKTAIQVKQPYYTSLVALQNSTYSRYLTEKARLTDMEGELTSLDNLRSVNLQGLNMSKEDGSAAQEGTRKYFQTKLDEIAIQYTAKQSEIAVQNELLKSIKSEYEQAGKDISAVNNELGFEKFFTQTELAVLDHYLKDAKISDSTFATFDVDVSGGKDSFCKSSKANVSFDNVSITDIQMTYPWECKNHHNFMYTGTPSVCPTCGSSNLKCVSGAMQRILTITGGTVRIHGDGYSLSADIINGILDQAGNNDIVFSAYLGSGTVNNATFPSGNLSCTCRSYFDMTDFLSELNFVVNEIQPSNHISVGDDHLDPFFDVWNSPEMEAKQISIAESALRVHNIGRVMQRTYGFGNVDLTQRPQVDAAAMRDAGWDVEDGGYATVFSSAFDVPAPDGTMNILHVTPILPNGDVLSPKRLEDYLYDELDRVDILGKDIYGIILRIERDVPVGSDGQVPDSVWEESDRWDIALHESQEEYFNEFNAFVSNIQGNGFLQALLDNHVIADSSAHSLEPYISIVGLLCSPSYIGDVEFTTTDNAFYFTRNVTEYQKYSVCQDLYDYAMDMSAKMAYPLYAFEVSSGNFIWAQEFEPFKNRLKLGGGIYLKLNEKTLLTPMLLEVHLDFEKPGNFNLVFSSEFQTKWPDLISSFSDMLKQSKDAAETLNFDKFKFGSYDMSGGRSAVENFLRNGLDAALQQIKAGKDQHILIDAGGIKIYSSSSSEYIHISNGMVALVDDSGNVAKMALGHFYNQASGTDFYGIIADIIGGVLIAGQNLIIECPDPNGGVMQFKVDSSGVIINNGRIYMQSDKGGKIGFDAHYGFFAGTSSLFETTDTGHVKPCFIDGGGDVIFDSDGFPKGVNVWIGIDGQAYFRGTIYATDGRFSGKLNASGFLVKGLL